MTPELTEYLSFALEGIGTMRQADFPARSCKTVRHRRIFARETPRRRLGMPCPLRHSCSFKVLVRGARRSRLRNAAATAGSGRRIGGKT